MRSIRGHDWMIPSSDILNRLGCRIRHNWNGTDWERQRQKAGKAGNTPRVEGSCAQRSNWVGNEDHRIRTSKKGRAPPHHVVLVHGSGGSTAVNEVVLKAGVACGGRGGDARGLGLVWFVCGVLSCSWGWTHGGGGPSDQNHHYISPVAI